MAAAGKTARGLRRIPKYIPPADELPREAPDASQRKQRRRKVKYSLFSLGQGLDMLLLIFILVLLAIGLVMLFSASYAYCYYYYNGNSYYYITRQASFAIVGVVAMLVISTFDYHHFHKLALPIAVGTFVLLAMVLLFKGTAIAPLEDSANRWLVFGPVNFQPSEIAKFALIVMFAHLISQNMDKMKTFKFGVLQFLCVLAPMAGLVAMENHLSATLIIIMLGGLLMLIGGTRFRWFAIGAGAVVLGLIFILTVKGGYQVDRITGWLDPFNGDPDKTYQIRQSLYAIGSGGFLGVGLGQSRQKYLYLPEPQNDFIFAIVCEELGMVGALVIMVLFGMLIWRGMYVALKAKDKFGTLLGLGITLQVGLQTVLNICVVTNTIPNTGISLPFFSYGGTALLMLLGEMGILLNISRNSNVEKT